MAKPSVIVTIPPIKIDWIRYYLIGSSPLVVHAFPEKARKEMLDRQMKNAKGGRDARDPFAEVEAAKYLLPDGRHGFPAVGFKDSAVTACTSLSDITKTAARQAFRIAGIPSQSKGVLQGSFVRTSLITLVAHPPTIREDVVRLSGIGRTPEMRYRPEYSEWGVILPVALNQQVISGSQLGSMLQAAGHGVGVGDYRPERDGDCGTFENVSRETFMAWAKATKLSKRAEQAENEAIAYGVAASQRASEAA